MEYVLIGLFALLVIGGGVTVLVMSATRGQSPASPEAGDDTPLGDTPQHSEADFGQPSRGGGSDEPTGDRYKRDPIGGEAEAETVIEPKR